MTRHRSLSHSLFSPFSPFFFPLFLPLFLFASLLFPPAATPLRADAELDAMRVELSDMAARMEALQARLDAAEGGSADSGTTKEKTPDVAGCDATESATAKPAVVAPVAAPPPAAPPAPAAAPATGSGEAAHAHPVCAAAADRIQIYGFMRLDASYDDSRLLRSHTPLFVPAETAATDDDSQFALFARHSRIGFRMAGRNKAGRCSRAQLEFDFYGGGTEEKAVPMMRHAFVELSWPERDRKILAGQTWELASPRIPSTVTYAAGYNVGNLAYRKPQLRLTQGLRKSPSTRLEFAAAMQQTLGPVDANSFLDTGTDAGRPTWVGHMGLQRKLSRGRVLELGVSGITGREEFHADAVTRADVDVRATAFDFLYRFHPRLELKGEIFRGSNLDGIGFAGIVQGFVSRYDDGGVIRTVNASRATGTFLGVDPVDTRGGWLDLVYRPNALTTFATGFGKDDPEDGLLPDGARACNRFGFVNVSRKLDAVTTVALELMHIRTDYVGGGSGDVNRVQMALMMSF